MKKNTVLKRLACFCLAAVLAFGIQPSVKTSAASKYPEVDAFKNSLTSTRESYKGIQGAGYRNQFYNDPISHTVWNCFMDQCIGNGEAFTYKGETYRFTLPVGLGTLRNLNSQKVTVSVVFLLQYVEGKTYLIADEARAPGARYYAPAYAAGSQGAKTLEAFWHYIMETCAKNNVHIDNFILGNEVNMPNSWHYSGGNLNSAPSMYAAAFATMWQSVREYSKTTRCSISLDHSWGDNDEGKGISGRNFVDAFAGCLDPSVDWCISYHLYPARLDHPAFWTAWNGMELNPFTETARFVDGRNLGLMTNYIKTTYGEQHRIMMTEEGFSDCEGEAIQAAALAYSYLAAKYDPMVDCFILHVENEGGMQNFDLGGKFAESVWKALDGPGKNQAVVDQCLGTIGVGSWSDIIANYGVEQNRVAPDGFVIDADGKGRMYKKDGSVDTSYTGWYNDGGQLYLMKEGVQFMLDKQEVGGDIIPVRNRDDIASGWRLKGGYTGWYFDISANSYLWAENWKDEMANYWENYDKNVPAKDKVVNDDRTGKSYLVDSNGQPVFGEYSINGKTYKTDENTGVYEGSSGLVLDSDGVRRYYDGLDVDESYSGWCVETEETDDGKVEKMYLLKKGVEVGQNIPSKDNAKNDAWYKDGDKYYWMDSDGTQAKNKTVYDALSDAWFVIKANGEVSLGSYDIDGKFYSCDSQTGVWDQKTEDITGKDLEWCTAGGKSYWYENGVRQGTFGDAQGVMGDGTVRGREICDPNSKMTNPYGDWFWLDSIYEGAKACNKEVWIPYIFQDEDTYDEAKKDEQAAMSGEMAEQVKNAINEKSGKWVRYDADGKMCKGWYTVEGDQAKIYPDQAGNTYYYDPITGLMAKGTVTIDGKACTFDAVTGVFQK